MRIVLRTSGGRGEYELAGRQGTIGVDDLLDHDLVFQLSPEITIDGHSAARRVQGKPRIRLDSREFRHAYAFLTGSLLLPQPKRALKETTTNPDFVRRNQYAVTDIDVDIAEVGQAAVDLRPTILWLGNAIGLTKSVRVARRMALVQSVWDKSRTSSLPVAALVASHEDAVLSGNHLAITDSLEALRKALDNDGDLLDELTGILGLEYGETGVSSTTNAVSEAGLEEEIDPRDAARRAVAQWRKSVVRSAEGRAFSQKVRSAYGDRCAFSGDSLPKLPHTASAGIDGAHILPWARYDLNTVRNGICLNKLCHWAFDAGVLRLDFNAGDYTISVPDRVKEEGLSAGMSLGYFEALQGSIPDDRLPKNPADRPAPTYLEQLNFEVFG